MASGSVGRADAGAAACGTGWPNAASTGTLLLLVPGAARS